MLKTHPQKESREHKYFFQCNLELHFVMLQLSNVQWQYFNGRTSINVNLTSAL